MRTVYTKKGDAGYTVDFSGKKLPKDDLRIVIGGKIDAVQAAIDEALLHVRGRARRMLGVVQRKLWQTAGEIAHCDATCLDDPITVKDLLSLERFIGSLGEPPRRFVRFNTEAAIVMNECRVRCRELETFLVRLLRKRQVRPLVYQYLNRLSNLFFMLAYTRIRK